MTFGKEPHTNRKINDGKNENGSYLKDNITQPRLVIENLSHGSDRMGGGQDIIDIKRTAADGQKL